MAARPFPPYAACRLSCGHTNPRHKRGGRFKASLALPVRISTLTRTKRGMRSKTSLALRVRMKNRQGEASVPRSCCRRLRAGPARRACRRWFRPGVRRSPWSANSDVAKSQGRPALFRQHGHCLHEQPLPFVADDRHAGRSQAGDQQVDQQPLSRTPGRRVEGGFTAGVALLRAEKLAVQVDDALLGNLTQPAERVVLGQVKRARHASSAETAVSWRTSCGSTLRRGARQRSVR